MAKQPEDVQTAESQTKVNAAPTLESSATDPRPVDTINAPLVFNDGTPVVPPKVEDDDKEFTLFHPGGSQVKVTGAVRRDALLQRGYTSSKPQAQTEATASA